MKPRSKVRALALALGAASVAGGCAMTSAVSERPASASTAQPEKFPKGSLPVLRIGMTAEEVQSLVGKPEKIVPLDTGAGAGETWIYRRVIDQQTTPDAVTTTHIAAFNGLPHDMGSEAQMQYRLKRTVTYQETALLIFAGKLVSSQQRIASSVSYDG